MKLNNIWHITSSRHNTWHITSSRYNKIYRWNRIILDISLHLRNHIVFIFNRINNHIPKLPSNHIVFIFKQSHCIHFQSNNNQAKYHFIGFDSILFLNIQAIIFQATTITFQATTITFQATTITFQKKIFGELTSVWRRWRFSCMHDRVAAAVAVAEEASVEETAEETGSSGVDNGRGDRWSREQQELRESEDEKWNNTRRVTIYRFKNISISSLTRTTADSFVIQTEAVLI
jgi:hypothetical protein